MAKKVKADDIALEICEAWSSTGNWRLRRDIKTIKEDLDNAVEPSERHTTQNGNLEIAENLLYIWYLAKEFVEKMEEEFPNIEFVDMKEFKESFHVPERVSS